MRRNLHRAIVFIVTLLFLATAIARLNAAVSTQDWNVTVLQKLLSQVQPSQKFVRLDDMLISTACLQSWYEHLTGNSSARSAFDQNFTAWPNGNVYYVFDAAITPAHQKAFLDGAGEWTTFANLHFIARTTQTNYIVVTNSASLEGGMSYIGMIGGPQELQIGPTAWNRPTICHELGHALGLVHEHQRSDRDTYVTIITSNIIPGNEADFVILPGSQNKSAYDFLSIMHYSQNAFSVDPSQNTIVANAPYTQYQNLMGNLYDPVLSQSDRDGMAQVYGPGPGAGNIVTNTADSGPGTLRAALYYAFDNPGTTITFNIPITDPGYSNNVFNILPTDGLPGLVNSTIVDGSTEPVQSNPNGPAILLNGILCQDPSVYPTGLQFRGSNCVAHGFIINNFPDCGVNFTSSNCYSNTLSGCYLGTDPTGTFAMSNGIVSLQIMNGAHNNLIGGLTSAARNLIDGSAFQGMVIRDPGSDHNIVEGNYLGLNASGTAPVPNSWEGIEIFGGPQANLIGGYIPTARNIISGNTYQGVAISDTNSAGNIIAGNYIGLDPGGTFAIPNGWAGVNIFGGAPLTVIGGDSPAARNVIAGNTLQGILVQDSGSSGTVIAQNYIGVDPTGHTTIPNGWSGVEIYNGPSSTMIGPSNLISGNLNYGVVIDQPGTVANAVQGNIIGLDATGSTALGNHYAGVAIYGGSQNNLIGGPSPGQGNLISGNSDQGVAIGNTGSTGNMVQGNYIGVDVTGALTLGNGWAGVNIYGGATSNWIGGYAPGAMNVISGNKSQGVLLQDTNTTGNAVVGNYIGLNASGTAIVSNSWTGVELYNGVSANQIGGPGLGRNFISGNGIYGVAIDAASTGNYVQGNSIGLDSANANPLHNTDAAIAIYGNCTSNYIGGTWPGAANLIADSAAEGVSISDPGSTNNTVRGNSIFGSTYAAIALYNNPNNNSPPPALSTAIITTNCTITGTFNGLSGVTYLLDFYADAPPAASAQSRTYLGASTIIGTGSSSAFAATLGAHLPPGRSITATATDPAGNTSGLATGVAATMTSSVNDGIPDAWRAFYFGGNGATTNSLSAASADPDHDGLNNLEEFLAGTNPTNAASVLYLTANNPYFSSNTVTLHSANGIVYQILFSDSLSSGSWSLLADQVVGDGGDISIVDLSASYFNQRFYRAKVAW